MSGQECKHCHGPHDVEVHKMRKEAHEQGKKCPLCDQMDREDHLRWSRARALAYLPADPSQAVASMVSDLRKHPAWQDEMAGMLFMLGIQAHSGSPKAAREWIEGWN